ncbi:MAG: hypothetical protein ABI887_03190, partial [Burkholderiales bacterium]
VVKTKQRGNRVVIRNAQDREELKLPHERDETAGVTDGVQDARIAQGNADIKRGVVDTSRATESDRAYRKLKR